MVRERIVNSIYVEYIRIDEVNCYIRSIYTMNLILSNTHTSAINKYAWYSEY